MYQSISMGPEQVSVMHKELILSFIRGSTVMELYCVDALKADTHDESFGPLRYSAVLCSTFIASRTKGIQRILDPR